LYADLELIHTKTTQDAEDSKWRPN